MPDMRQFDRDTGEAGEGPFPDPQPRERPWEEWEKDRGPFERRSAHDRRAPNMEADEDRSGGRRRWGRRKSDVLTTEGRESLANRGQKLFQTFREPIIGLTLAGLAVPLVNAGMNPATAEKAAGERTRPTATTDEEIAANRDLEVEVGDYWAEAEEEIVRNHTVEGAVTRYDIDQGLAEKIYDAASTHGIEPDVAYGLVFTESTFRERAVSHVGARGLTQLMPRTAQWLDPEVRTRDLYDPDVNLDLGFRYLRQLIDKYEGDVEKALTAYNRGPGTVDRILSRGGNPDNGYAGKVLSG